MQRYFIPESSVTVGETMILDQEISHHMLKVMRNQVKESVYLVSAEQMLYEAVLIEEVDKKAKVKIKQQLATPSTELPINVTIACGLSKNDKLDWIVQKGTECGMSAFIPIALQRDVVKWPAKKVTQRIERLQKIAKEAAQQSYRLKVPKVDSYTSFKQLLDLSKEYDHLFVAYEETAKNNELKTLVVAHESLRFDDKVLVVFGSEGGFNPTEITQLEEVGFIPIGLGPRILRAETAPIYYLATLSYISEMMNKPFT